MRRLRPWRLLVAASTLATTSTLLVGGTALAGFPRATPAGPQLQASASGPSNWGPDPAIDTAPPAVPDGVPVATVQTWLAQALEVRAEELGTLHKAVTTATGLPDSVRSALLGDVQKAVTGIDALAAGVSSDTTLVALRADIAAMITTYRVFAVVQPQARLVLDAEHQLAVVNQLAGFEPALQTAIDTERSSGKVPTLSNLNANLVAGVATVQVAAGGVVIDLLAQTPGDYTDAAAAITGDAKTLATGWSRMATLRSDVGQILSLLAG